MKMQAIDLTTFGAAVPLPPRDHPIFRGVAEMPNLYMSREEMAFQIIKLQTDIEELRRFVGLVSEGNGNGG